MDLAPPVSRLRRFTDMYRMNLRRQRLLWRSLRSRHQLSCCNNRTREIGPDAILCVMVVRNEMMRLPFSLDYHRKLGVDHFLIVDNASTDDTGTFLADQPDVSVWQSGASYRASRFGLDWATWLQMRYAHGHWCLTLDADELLVYAHCDTRPLRALTDWLTANGRRAFGALMLDLYANAPLGTAPTTPVEDPRALLQWFDAGPFTICRQQPLQNLWVRGGIRARHFFAETPDRAPTLNKLPLVRWNRHFAYVNSTHSLLPRSLNHYYDGPGGDAPSGVLLHSKFLPDIVENSASEQIRREHFHNPDNAADYYDAISKRPNLWHADAHRYDGWPQLEKLGLLNSAGWADGTQDAS